MKNKECCFCKKDVGKYGNNALPIMEGVCCDKCNYEFVLPIRLIKIREDVDFVEMFKDEENKKSSDSNSSTTGELLKSLWERTQRTFNKAAEEGKKKINELEVALAGKPNENMKVIKKMDEEGLNNIFREKDRLSERRSEKDEKGKNSNNKVK